MKRVDRILQILVIVTISLSGLLLGMSQGDFEPFFIAVTAATAAWVFVDVARWFSLPQWLANLIAITVTAFTMASFFFTGDPDPVRQLLGVGKLLVYLESILLFQVKSARVYWQVLVLSLLQIVVGAVFNLGFEGGLLFILYVMFAGFSVLILHLYQQQQLVPGPDSGHGPARPDLAAGRSGLVLQAIPSPLKHHQPLGLMTRQYSLMGIGVLVFGIVLFYFLPRENSSWSGPLELPMRQTGYQQRISLNHPELIPLSSTLEMTVKYRRPGSEQVMLPVQLPYLRGMTLPKLVIEDNETTWLAATSQVKSSDFSFLPDIRQAAGPWLIQEIVLEPTDDPLLYSPVPPCSLDEESDDDIEYCWPLGGITRERESKKISFAHHRYTLAVPILPDGTFYAAWPYRPRSGDQPLTERDDPGIWRWLTYLDQSRYPGLVRVAGQIAARMGTDDHYRLARAMEDHFRSDGGFNYTVDFREVSRDRRIDAIEDFFTNHKSGHCVYYASALTLMLRSQGIPARVVVGFRGGVANDIGTQLDVEARHGHAWVEAYVRPQDCPSPMKSTGQAGRLGAWMQLDATPAVDFDIQLSANALNYAKSFWRDYVLGLQSDTGSTVIDANGIQLTGFLKFLDLSWWQAGFTTAAANFRRSGTWQNWLWTSTPLILIAAIAVGVYVYRRRSVRSLHGAGNSRQAVRGRAWFRRQMARLAEGVSPRLARWLEPRPQRAAAVPFYQHMLKLLGRAGLVRQPGQTHREFALRAGQSGPSGHADELTALTTRITDFYYLVRYGARPLSDRQQLDVRQSLEQLERLLAATGPETAPVTDESDS